MSEEVTMWVVECVKDGEHQKMVFESYIEAYDIYADLKRDKKISEVTITQDKKFLLKG